jgi:soluble lytic murein transglycosylase
MVSESLSRAELPALEKATLGQLLRALRLFPNWEPLRPVADQVLAQSSCPSTALLTALGSKTEEYFPAPEFRALALKFYARSAGCGKAGDEPATRARYRASLLQIWAGDCVAAMKGLAPLAQDKEGEFNSRSLYWRAYCAEQEGNKLQAAALKGRLFKEYPLSYHGLILARGVNKTITQVLDLSEPKIRFRTAMKPEVNPLVRAAEVLIELEAYDLAAELLATISDEIETTETPFRLYYAYLLRRSGDMIGQFRTLSTLFREQPGMISRDTLHMFYPLKRFEVLKAQASRVDPLLVASLIRQESGFNERARSPAGAKGLMQLMPDTARRMERGAQRRLFDPNTNIRLGVRYFYGLIDRFAGDAELALAGYNAGPDRVDEWKRRYTTENRMLFLDLIPFKETRDYVALISRNYYWYLSLYGGRDIKLRDENGHRPAVARKNPLVLTLFDSQ